MVANGWRTRAHQAHHNVGIAQKTQMLGEEFDKGSKFSFGG